MFKFNFQNDTTESENNTKESNIECDLEWLPAEEISTSCLDVKKPQTWGKLNFNGYELHYILPSVISSFVKNNKEILAADVIPAKYEGGLKVWDITHLVATLFTDNNPPVDFKNKSVLDLGCGNGLIGSLAIKLGADKVHFQDYNSDVIKMATIPTVLKNSNDSLICKFFSGDWESFSELTNETYDIIVTNATIYYVSSYNKLLTVFKKKLKRDGAVLVGAKTYYFGYGGGTRQFEEALEKDGTFASEVIWTSLEGVRHEILKVTFRS